MLNWTLNSTGLIDSIGNGKSEEKDTRHERRILNVGRPDNEQPIAATIRPFK